MYIGLHVKYPLFLSDLKKKPPFYLLYGFSKNAQISNFMKIRPVGTELLHAGGRTEGQTYMTKLIVALRNFANAHKTSPIRKLVKMHIVLIWLSHQIPYIARNSWPYKRFHLNPLNTFNWRQIFLHLGTSSGDLSRHNIHKYLFFKSPKTNSEIINYITAIASVTNGFQRIAI
jgi:hypothetical protein